MKFPTLYARSSKGEVKVWQISVVDELISTKNDFLQNTPHIVTTWGLLNGRQQTTKKPIASGKNVGKANETSPRSQALADAQSKWERKKDSRYQETIPSTNEKHSVTLPMLAHPYKKRKHNVKWPAAAQPKLDGVRCTVKKVSHSKITFTSRKGKPFNTLSHLEPDLLRLMEIGEEWDGELFTQDITFQQITAAVRRESSRHPDMDKIQYWIYDVVNETMAFKVRRSRLDEAFGRKLKIGPLVRVRTWEIKDEKSLFALHAEFVKSGFEGTMVRNWNGLYKRDYRSADLLKYKDFQDAEFKIIDGVEGSGKDAGTVIFVCETADKQPFKARPRGTHAQRTAWWNDLENLKGCELTVRYQDVSDDGIPRFPVGITIRDYD